MGLKRTASLVFVGSVWPSEEVLTLLCVARRDWFRDKLVVEVGGGMTCLAGVTVLLTDGNETSVQNVARIRDRNRPLFGTTDVVASRLRWTEPTDVASLRDKFDVILSADCLFFDDARDALARFILAALKPGGVALVVAPARSGTLDRFQDEVFRCGLRVVRLERYGALLDDVIHSHRSNPTFDPDLHLPVLLELSD
ncbi:calmodulin-lysine N-methyltransferase-like [Pollicipes pollicipes]|uniref:calmodulin-lysine N-methyltransferase-like n=1 Tax=Pollicipes pollicipes TaxID=41117 RepID=UPI0018859EB7|nr:calmodulin-lysine N-methyltransferase-like [Pollicipes pollicipes]